MKLIISVAAASVLLTGCLKTRNDVRDNQQRQVMQQQVVTLQKTNADAAGRVSDIEEQMRELNGRVDIVENKLGQSHSGVESALKASQQQNVDLNTKVTIMQEALATMEKQIYALNTEVNALRAERIASAQAAEKAAKQAKRDPYAAAQDNFNKKDWKQSILNFQKYRDENPKGPKFADATYKIGVSFQELGMKDEAKTFYDEVVSKFPKSEEARRAKIRLKGLKK
ncbi:tetratricopeptide repeat protein [Bdellovibrio bacteriovorus]|uniref:tetratricopeptide repeat protein n=1 Tax=Bdellovibrio bacteriovorus TaxID=959 RepID=UPI0021CE29D6|nr:tetratricopeptide repeat protein [Bdellovibrio bacteriovorus]UXR64829.1 tetratricopeptide repeat protein [Bdellovibrio bacteriovorus]